MGYIKHNAVLAVFGGFEETLTLINAFIESLRAKLIEDDLEGLILVSDPMVNECRTYVFIPDGSKIGWAYSDRAAVYRQLFFDEMQKLGCDVIAIKFGGDNSYVRVTTEHIKDFLIDLEYDY